MTTPPSAYTSIAPGTLTGGPAYSRTSAPSQDKPIVCNEAAADLKLTAPA